MDSLWYLDNGASNHMTGVREHFKELDEKVSGKVKFGDGSYIEIKGKGSILIEFDDENQRIISHVYYIPSLKSNLLSLRQFTKIGCKVVMEDDKLQLYDMDNKIFMEVTQQRNHLYKASLRIATFVPTKALEDITPYEAIKQKMPNLENLKVFGCIAYAKVPSQHLTKLDDRSTKMVYLGNEQGSKAYRLFDPTTRKICVSRDVKFKEDETWDWSEYLDEHINDEPNDRFLYGVNTQEGKGTTGIIFYYGDSPISWSTQKQATVALSSCESEFIAATAAATQALWLKRLLSRLTHSKEEKITIMVDNKSAIALMKNPVFHGRSKHIDTKYHFIRECVEREDIQVEFVSGEYQKADILTKALPKIKFLIMRQLIGLKDLRHSVCD
ncbi:zinc finger, CCHC-type containing protein [Tanacetum coccineum]|uniref:Zinc finger, CCHC-type containing protein n=1 Tax=Tanacetum coccineum TaxID=301880 RepID=A0ABQ4ZXA3_9ASTR